ncbi:hypothetical protein [Kitasatospora sp. MMS16-BH015]|uniref:hypothetical protein n=1 Tax=Kitasatospora sp. MMS16-BH015 TaxID=2018025 RepID=UPI000CF2B8DE|nr:hypothetical protein [Kitasatospora sp. MMS16-BH015]
MSDVSQTGFTAARRGYAPEQVDRALVALTGERDSAWERLAVLGAGIREMEKRLAVVRQQAADAPEPDYGVLSEQADKLMKIAEAEAMAVREKAELAAEDERDAVYDAGQLLDAQSKEYAVTTRSEADQAARRTEERTRAEAERLRAEADADARTIRDTATADAAKVRVSAAEAEERAEGKLAELRRRADEMFAAAEARADAEDAKISATAERRLKEAEQHREQVLAQIKQGEVEAQAKADQLVEAARREAEKIRTASEREQREFAARQEVVQQHLDHIKQTLAALTGAAVGAIEPGLLAAEPKALAAAAGVVADPEPVAPRAVEPRAVESKAVEAVETTVLPTVTPAAAETAVLPVVPPAPALPPKPEAAPDAPAPETKIIPKIVIVDDGSEYDTMPNTVVRRRR